jgi:hypothetical protein
LIAVFRRRKDEQFVVAVVDAGTPGPVRRQQIIRVSSGEDRLEGPGPFVVIVGPGVGRERSRGKGKPLIAPPDMTPLLL